MKAYEIVTGADLNAAAAVFTTRAEAQAAADAAMPRRKHGRPYAQGSGWHWGTRRSLPGMRRCRRCRVHPAARMALPDAPS